MMFCKHRIMAAVAMIGIALAAGRAFAQKTDRSLRPDSPATVRAQERITPGDVTVGVQDAVVGPPTVAGFASFQTEYWTSFLYSGGSPPTRLDMFGNKGYFNEGSGPTHPVARAFRVVLLPPASSNSLGLGDINCASSAYCSALADAYAQAHPSWSGYGQCWCTSGTNPSLGGTLNVDGSQPRDLFSRDVYGDFLQFDVAVTGTPNIGDGIIGWNHVADDVESIYDCDHDRTANDSESSVAEMDCDTDDVCNGVEISSCSGSPACGDCDGDGVPNGCELSDCDGSPACQDCNVNGVLGPGPQIRWAEADVHATTRVSPKIRSPMQPTCPRAILSSAAKVAKRTSGYAPSPNSCRR